MADAADQATIAGHRVTAALAALGQVLGARLTVEPAPGVDIAMSPDLQGFRDACTLLNVPPPADVRSLDFGPGYVQIATRRPDSDVPAVLTLEVVDGG